MKKIRFILYFTFSILIASVCFQCRNDSGSAGSEGLPDEVSYNFDIRPILSDKCYACHGPDGNKRKAGLRLDIADSAFAPLKETKGAFALIPGKPEQSEV